MLLFGNSPSQLRAKVQQVGDNNFLSLEEARLRIRNRNENAKQTLVGRISVVRAKPNHSNPCASSADLTNVRAEVLETIGPCLKTEAAARTRCDDHLAVSKTAHWSKELAQL